MNHRFASAAFALTFLTACTALDTHSTANGQFDESKPHVGQYYLLPKALITVEGTSDADGNYAVSTSMSLVADHRYKYFLKWKPNAFYEDTIKNLDVDSDGMLTSVNYSAEDKSPAIISDIVSTAINIFKIAGELPLNRGAGPSVKRPPFKYTFDPFNAVETNRVRGELRRQQLIALSIAPDPASIHHLRRTNDPESGGVFYHPPTTIDLLIVDLNNQAVDALKDTPKTAKGSSATQCHVVMTVPDLDRVACFRLGRAFMTKREANLTFAHGMPAKLVFKQPSAVQAVTGTPSAVTGAIGTSIPTLVKVSDDRKIAALQEQNTLVTEQSKLLEAQKKLIEDQRALARTQSGTGDNGGSGSNRSNTPEMTDLRNAMQQQRDNITNLTEKIRKQRQDIKDKLQSSGLNKEDIQKAIEAADLNKEED